MDGWLAVASPLASWVALSAGAGPGAWGTRTQRCQSTSCFSAPPHCTLGSPRVRDSKFFQVHPRRFTLDSSSSKVHLWEAWRGPGGWLLFPLLSRARPGSEELGRLGLGGDGGGGREAEAGARLETQGASVQLGEVHSQQAKECEEQHGDSPLTDCSG